MKTTFTLNLMVTLLMVLFSSHNFAATNVSGLISTSVTWQKANSPYIVTGNMIVLDGATLTIEPGTQVLFDATTTIQVSGALIAVGTAANHIVFSANTNSPTKGFWNNIYFTGPNAGKNPNNSAITSYIKYCDFSYGGSKGNAMLKAENATLKINNSTFSNCKVDAIYLINSPSNIDSCIINDNDGKGIYYSNPNYEVTVNNNLITKNGFDGIHFSGSLSSIFNISGNTISFNKGAIYFRGGTFNITNNIIKENTQYIILNLSSYYGYNNTPSIMNNNSIINNTTSSTQYPCISLINGTSAFSPFITKNITNNVITNNTATRIFQIDNFAGKINDNQIKNNCTYEVYNLNSAAEAVIDAKNNYWNRTRTDLDAKIYDYFDNSDLSLVYLDPTTTTLPVALTSFTASKQNNNVLLNWSTSSEQNNSHFKLSHATDGVNFTLLSKLPASINGSIKNNYSYAHLSPAKGANYYHLEQVDLDGTVRDLGIKAVNFSLNTIQKVVIYPNPTQNEVKVNFEKDFYTTAKLIDLQGKILQKKNILLSDTQLTFDLNSLDAGNYLIQLEGKGTDVQKVVKE